MEKKKKIFLISLFLFITSCSGNPSNSTLTPDSFYDVSFNVLVSNAYGSSFIIKDIYLDDDKLCFSGDFVFNSIDSSWFFISADSNEGRGFLPYDFDYFLNLETTNEINGTSFTSNILNYSGSLVLCFSVDSFFHEQVDNPYDYEFDGDKLLYAYFAINDPRANRTSFWMPFYDLASKEI